MTRTRGIMVRTLALPADREPAVYSYALTVSAGTVYVICSEGVGWEVTSDRPLFVDTWSGGYELELASVMTAASLGESVDLADHIRTFGFRLERNFYTWASRLAPVPAPVADRVPEVMSGWCDYCRRYNRPCGRHES